MDEEITLVRVYLKEGDRGVHKRLLDEILELLHAQGVGGATVFRGVAGFGGHGAAEGDLLHLAGNLPMVVEFFARPDQVETAVDALRQHHPGLHIVHWRAAARR